ncbi:hypothetical protein NDI45_20500 [Leptolyngbya sp. GB1-A1]|uniref:hypothetical protein n=1 Tax=Leptolyngbya sp. GB1-A1 TaxID=2933908 RepID=UPI003298F9F0
MNNSSYLHRRSGSEGDRTTAIMQKPYLMKLFSRLPGGLFLVPTLLSLWIAWGVVANAGTGRMRFVFSLKLTDLIEIQTEVEKSQ